MVGEGKEREGGDREGREGKGGKLEKGMGCAVLKIP